MGRNYLPAGEAQFTDWVGHFLGTLTKKPEAYHVSQSEIDELTAEYDQFDEQYKEAIAARDAAQAAMQARDDQRQELEARIRSTARRIQADDRVTDANRREAGLPVHKTSRKPVPAPTSAPMGNVILSNRLEQVLYFSDSENKRRRPAGAIGVEVYMCVGDAVAPVNPSNYKFVEVCSRSPRKFDFNESDANRVAHYLLRWVNHKGEVGPWSAPISGTIPAV